MNLWLLKPGHRIRTHDGAEAEVLAETEDGTWLMVRHLGLRLQATERGRDARLRKGI